MSIPDLMPDLWKVVYVLYRYPILVAAVPQHGPCGK